MKTLDTKEWIAVVVSLCVVGIVFVTGPNILSFFIQPNQKPEMNTTEQPSLGVEDKVLGGGDIATPGSRVTVNYVGHFTDGKVFDSSLTRGEPFQFVLGAGEVIEGWDKGVEGMRVGGTRILTVPPQMGYGANDFGPIPGNSTLVFEVQLLKVEKQ